MQEHAPGEPIPPTHDRTHDGVRDVAPPPPPGPIAVYTWATIADRTGLTPGDVATLTAEWIGEPGYLHGGLPTQATLDLLHRQAATGLTVLDQHRPALRERVCVRDRKWRGRYTGTIVRVDSDGNLFVQWHGVCVEDQVRPDEVEPVDMPNPPDNGLRLIFIGG
jgi:hypothetical protein